MKKLIVAMVASAALCPGIALAATETVLYAFKGGTDGQAPFAGVIAGPDGALYGTTGFGGSQLCPNNSGCGIIFKLTPRQDGTYSESVLYAFQGGTDGYGPDTELLLDASGNLFGTTGVGGDSTSCPSGCGTVFEIAPDGTHTVLHAFQGGTDGAGPASPLFRASDGNIYGTTFVSRYSRKNGYSGGGTLFVLKPSGGGWSFSVVYELNNKFLPQQPRGPLAEESDSRLYATFGQTYVTRAGVLVQGAVASLTLQSVADRPQYNFAATQKFAPATDINLSFSESGLSEDRQGNLYGAGARAKTFSELSTTVFRFTPNTLPEPGGRFNRLYDFKQDATSLGSISGLTVDAAGTVFGTATYSGLKNPVVGPGGVFKLTPPAAPSGLYTETDIYRFTGGADGNRPYGRLVIDAQGNLYGTTSYGGAGNFGSGNGVVYRITP